MSIIHVNDIIPVISTTLLKKQILLFIFLYVLLLSTMPSKSSYRQNRGSAEQFCWTYNQKRDVYNCYLKAKVDPMIGYLKRLKNCWDEHHTEFIFLSDKNLRDQASQTEKNKVVMKTEFESITATNNENVSTNENNCLENKNLENFNDSIIERT